MSDIQNKISPQPSFNNTKIHLFAGLVIENLVAADFADGDVFRVGMRKMEAADAAGGV